MKPAYLEAYNNGTLDRAIAQTRKILSSCAICPRKCRVNRLKDQKGFCKTGEKARVYSFMAHHGEEPPVSGKRGSGTIFFSFCNMACVYCQNFEFSQQGGEGKEVTSEELANIMLELQGFGCHNINLVSPTHVMPQILQALKSAIKSGLNIPLVYNSGGYELAEIIRLMDGLIDIYLPDMRYADNETAKKYSSANDYPEYNRQAVKEMHRQSGTAEINGSGIMTKGLIIRHLVLPGDISGTDKIMKFISEELSPETYISLMSQYFPCYKSGDFPELSRKISLEEYESAQTIMEKYGLHNGWIQESGGLDRFAGINIKPNLKTRS
ncbi:MAG: radical SAM protein [Candidatus Omnitrophica bacterium]|nr:radical SAM protein [Candidatus Omnitrophota bacterium]